MSQAITIIIPCFNPSLPIFRKTLESVRRSTFQNYRVLVVNDGSTDSAFLGVLVQVQADDPRIQVIHHPGNRGLSAARNTGVAHCRTPYFLQLDADDLIEPTFLEKCLWALVSHSEWQFCNSWSIAFGAKNYLWDRGFERGIEFLVANQITPTAVIRRGADRTIGGHDETIRDGCEDWDYWLKMAAHGFWGGTIPEYLTRYRYHAKSTYWPNRDDAVRLARFRREMRRRYPRLWKKNGFPRLSAISPLVMHISDELPFTNPLPKPDGRTRLLMLLPWMALSGTDRVNLNLVQQLTRLGFDITLVVTSDRPNPWLPEFFRYTSDIFVLRHFLHPEDYPRLLRYMIESRRIDVVLVCHSMLGYALLPYLRSHCPQVTFVDYHHVTPNWPDSDYGRIGLNYQKYLDLNIVTSQQVKAWMVERGGEADRIGVGQFTLEQRGARMSDLLRKARELSRTAPRAGVNEAEGLTTAAQAIEDTHQGRLPEGLRLAEEISGQQVWQGSFRSRAAKWLKKRVFWPAYFWALAHGIELEWVLPLASRFYRRLKPLRG